MCGRLKRSSESYFFNYLTNMPINYVAVVLAAAACFIIGFLVHGPIAGKLWMKLANVHPTGKEKFSDMYGQMFWNFISNLVCAYVIAMVHLFVITSIYTKDYGPLSGTITAFWLWLGFNVTATSMNVIWMKQPFKLWMFENISSLICFLAMGAIIGMM